MRASLILAFALAGLAAHGQSAAAQAPGFHPPTSVVETSLDRILRATERDDATLTQLIEGRGGVRAGRYRRWATPGLIAAIRAADQRLVDSDCGGKRTADQICGIDWNPLTCAQDSDPTYLYKTIEVGEQLAVVDYVWSEGDPAAGEPATRFRLRRAGGEWLVDGVRCSDGTSLNMGAAGVAKAANGR